MPDDEVQFKSPTTGKIQAIPPEHWDEAIKAGYQPTTHKVMYDPDGNRGMVPNAELHDKTVQGYVYRPEDVPAPVEEKSPYQRLTEPDQTTANPLYRFLSNAGAQLPRLPENLYEAGKEFVRQYATQPFSHIGLNPAVAKSVVDLMHTPLKGALSVAPEAFGTGTGQVAFGEALPYVGQGIGAGRAAVGRRLYSSAPPPAAEIAPGETIQAPFKPGVEKAARIVGTGAGATAGAKVGSLFGPHGAYYGAGVGGTAGAAFTPWALRKAFPPPPVYPGAPLPLAADALDATLGPRGAFMNRGYKPGEPLPRPGDPFGPDYTPTGAILPSFEDFEQATRVAKPVSVTRSPVPGGYTGPGSATDASEALSPARSGSGGASRTSPFDLPGVVPERPSVPGSRGEAWSMQRKVTPELQKAATAGDPGAIEVMRRLNPGWRPVITPVSAEFGTQPRSTTRFTPGGEAVPLETPPEAGTPSPAPRPTPLATPEPYTGPERRAPGDPLRRGVYDMQKELLKTDAEREAERMGSMAGIKAGPSAGELLSRKLFKGRGLKDLSDEELQSVISEYNKAKGSSGRGVPPPAPMPTPEPAAPQATRSADFSRTGNYDVNIGGNSYKIYRDPETGGWYESDPKKHFSESYLGSSQQEALQWLSERRGKK